LARLGTERDDKSQRTIRILGREVELPGKSDLARDVGFHPDGVHLATVGEGRPIEVYRVFDGKPIRTIAEISGPFDVMIPFGWGRVPWEFPPHLQGFDRIAFSDSGRFMIAGPVAECTAWVYEFETGTQVGSLWEGFDPFAVHPRWELVAMIRNDQGGTEIRFTRLPEPFRRDEGDIGWGSPRVRVSDDEDEWGWFVPSMVNVSGMVFSPEGDTFALSGGPSLSGNKPLALSVHEFPSLHMRFMREIESGDELNDETLPAPGWATRQSFAFGPDGRRLYGLSGKGSIITLDAMTGEVLGDWQAHEGLVTTLDVQHRTGTLVSGGLDGEVKVWEVR
jgi:WD40 repeat protein